MSEYIDKDVLLHDIRGQHPDDALHYPSWYEGLVKKQPAVVVLEPIRCKDCKYFYDGYDQKCCISHVGLVLTDENGYCHHAKRRNNSNA